MVVWMAFDGNAACGREADTMKTKLTWKYALIALGALATASLLAQYAGPGARTSRAVARSPQRQAAALESLRAYLGLSEAQVLQLQDLSTQNRAAMKATSDKIRSNQATLHAILSSGAPADEAQTGRLVLEWSSLRGQIEASRQELAQEATAILTPDQQQKLAALSSTLQTQRQASPQAMPEAWPMIHAASQLGLIVPPARGERLGARFHPDPGAGPAQQN
jgi:Spy/CpxP family protein refolding chaperone